MTTEKIELKKLKLGKIKVTIIGDSPYLPEPMDFEMLEMYDKKRSNQIYTKDIKSEEDKLLDKKYLTDDKKEGIPSRAFYNSMIRGSSYLFERKDGGMRNIKEGVIVMGEILPLKWKKKRILKHWGKTSGRSGSPKLILRNAYDNWSCELTIQYNTANISAEQIINVLNWSGFHIGVGAFRKENTGNYGLFHVKL